MSQPSVESKELAIGFYNRAKELRAEKRLDDAITQLKEGLKISPESVRIRKTLREVEAERFRKNKLTDKAVRMRVGPALARINMNRTARRWSEVARQAEEALEVCPLDSSLNAALGEALRKLNLPNVAWFAYDYALQSDPNNVDILSATAELLEEMEQFEKALKMWKRAAKFRNSTYVHKRVNALSAKVFMDSSKFESAGNAGDLKAATDIPKPSSGGHVAVAPPQRQTSRNEGRQRKQDPVEALLAIADDFVQSAQLKDAVSVLNAAVEISDGDQRCVELLELVSQGVN